MEKKNNIVIKRIIQRCGCDMVLPLALVYVFYIILHGHTHVQAMDNCGGHIYLNPGSVSIPKNGNENSYWPKKNEGLIEHLQNSRVSAISHSGRAPRRVISAQNTAPVAQSSVSPAQ